MKDLKSRRRTQGGFTLLELLLVVITLAILAALAIPQFTNTAARAREAEALEEVSAIRGSLERYRLQNGSFGAASFTTWNLDLGNPVAAGASTRWFNYTLLPADPLAAGATTYTIQADLLTARTIGGAAGTPAVAPNNGRVSMTNIGTLTCSGVFPAGC